MTTPAEDSLRYPVGRFAPPAQVTAADREGWIAEIERAPALLRAAFAGLDDARLDTPYRPGGWTLRQVAHHVPESHMNAYVRFKLALTEDAPTIKPYDEARWAELPDVPRARIADSLALTDALHARWVTLLRAMAPADFARTFVHPEHPKPMTLERVLALYAWHGRHHTAHVTRTREANGW